MEVPLEEAKALRVNTVDSAEESTEALVLHGGIKNRGFCQGKMVILPGKMMKMVISLGENDDITWEDGDVFLKLVIFSRKRVDLTKQGRPKWRFGWGAGIYWGYTRSDDLESCSSLSCDKSNTR